MKEDIKIKLENYLKTYGIKARHLAIKLGINETVLSHYRHDRKILNDKDTEKLNDFLNRDSM